MSTMTAASRGCLHCGTFFSGEEDFCCLGCRSVYQILQTKGLGQYYTIPNRVSSPAGVKSKHIQEYSYLDHPDFWSLYVKNNTIEFYIEGIQCTACVWLLEKLHEIIPEALTDSRLNLGKSLLSLELKPQASLSLVAAQIRSLGYLPHPVLSSNTQPFEAIENRKSLVRVGVAGAATGNIMLLAISIYGGAPQWVTHAFNWVSFGLYLPVLLYSGQPLLRSFWSSLRTRRMSIDVPLVTGILLASALSLFQLLTGGEDIYFDSLAALIFLLLATRHVLKVSQRSALGSAGLLHFLTPAVARKKGEPQLLPIQRIQNGDILEIHAGEIIPVDGVITQGRGSIQNALLTGEAEWIDVHPESVLHAGALYQGQPIELQVTASGIHTRIGQIVRDIESAALRKAQIQVMADRWAGLLLTLVLIVAALIFGALTWMGNPAEGLRRAIALTLVACPCGFALATPLAWALSLAQGAKMGVLIKGPDILEKLHAAENIFFDKTGTLTEGKPRVIEFETHRPELNTLWLEMESHSHHPIAQAIVQYLKTQIPPSASPVSLIEKTETLGVGVAALYQDHRYEIRSDHTPSSHQPGTHVAFFEDDQKIATAILQDPIRPDAKAAVEQLTRLGKKIFLISGDRPQETQRIAKDVGIPESHAFGSMSPEKKQNLISQSKATLMIGDGANDAAALAAADVGAAVHGGMEVCMRAGDIYFSRAGLAPLIQTTKLAEGTLKIIWIEFWISAAYNLLGATLAATGKVQPLSAAIFMPISALTVTLSTILLSRRLARRIYP